MTGMTGKRRSPREAGLSGVNEKEIRVAATFQQNNADDKMANKPGTEAPSDDKGPRSNEEIG